MKDIQFTVKQQKTEIKLAVASLLLAIGINVYAIISFGTQWKELYTQWLTTLILAAGIYFLTVLLRLVWRWIPGRLLKSRKG